MGMPLAGLFNWSVVATDRLIPIITYGWLIDTCNKLADSAKAKCKAATAGITVNIVPFVALNKDTAYISIFQLGGQPPHDKIHQWAFDYVFTVPPGGYTPPTPPGYFEFHTPAGVKRFRRSYHKKAGQTISRKGYFSEAIREVMTRQQLDSFSYPLAKTIGWSIVERIKIAAERQGAISVVVV